MDDEEEYDSEYSDSTVLLTDYAEQPEKINNKRRRLSNLLDRGNQSDPHEDENKAPDDVSVNRQTDNSKKRRDNVDKDWNVVRYLACIDKNNEFDIQNDGSKNETNFQQLGDILKENTPKIGNNNEIICLDSDDETQTDEAEPNQDKDNARIFAMNDCDRNATPKVLKSVNVRVRRVTTDVIELNNIDSICEDSQWAAKEKQPIIRVLKPSAINARRATTHFEDFVLNCESNKKKIYIPVNDQVQSKKEKVADVVNTTTPKADELFSNTENSFNNVSLDSNNIRDLDTAVYNENTKTSSVTASKNETDINKNDNTRNENSRQDIMKSTNVKVYKRVANISETEREPKRSKKNAESNLMGPEQSNKVILNPALNLKQKSKSSMLGVNITNELYEKYDKHKTDEQLVIKRSDEREKNKANNLNTPEGVLNKLFENGEITSKSLDKQESVKLRDKEVISESSHKQMVNKIQDKVVTQEERDRQRTNKIQTNESTNNLPNKLEVSNVQYGQEQRKVQDVNKVQGNQDAAKLLNTLEVCNLQDKQKISAVHDMEETNNIKGKQGTTNVQNKLQTGKQHDEQETSEVNDKQETSKGQVNQSATKVLDEIETRKQLDEGCDNHETGKVHNERNINEICNQHESREKQLVPNESEAQHKEQTSKVLDKAVRRNSSDKQETCKLQASDESDANKQDKKVTNSLPHKQIPGKDPNTPIVSKTNMKQKKCKVPAESDTRKIEDEHMTSAPSNKPQSGAEHYKQKVSKVQGKDISQIFDTQKPQKADSEYRNVELSNMQEVGTENETSEAKCAEVSDRILTFQVGFFTLIKEYLKNVFPESAKILHDLIKSLIVNTEKGQVQTDVRYCCPKCSRVSNYSSGFLFNTEHDENRANVVASPDCGFCRGIRKIHTSYLKRFMCKKDNIDNNKKKVKKACTEKDHVKQSAEQSANSSIRDTTSNNSQTTSEIKKYNNSACTSSAAGNSNSSSIIDNKNQKKITLTQSNCDVNTTNHDVSEKRLVHKETPKKTSQLDIYYNKFKTNNNFKKGEQEDTGKEVTDQDLPITKGTGTSAQCSNINYKAAATIILRLNSKRKNNENNIQKADHKRMKTNRNQNTVLNVENLTPNVNQTNMKGNDSIADEPNKVVILSLQNVTSRTAEKVNSSLENNNVLNTEKSTVTSSLDTKVNRGANEYNYGNTLEKSSNTPKEKHQTNTSDRNCTQEIHLKPSNSDNITAVEAGGLDNRNKHIAETDGESMKKLTVENMPQKVVGNTIRNVNNSDREGKVGENGRKNENVGDKPSIDSIPKTVAENHNAKQIQHPNGTDKDNESIIKSLVESFERIKSKAVANDNSPAKTNEENIQLASMSKRRNSLDSLPNSETKKKIIVKYICPVCTCAYVYLSKFSSHIKKQHHLNYTTIPESCVGLQCPYCPVILCNQKYNKHVKQYHPEKFEQRVENMNSAKLENAKCSPIKNKETNPESNKASESPNPKYIEQQKGQNDCASKHMIKQVQTGDGNIDKRDNGEKQVLDTTKSEEKNNNFNHTYTTASEKVFFLKLIKNGNSSLRNDHLYETGETSHKEIGCSRGLKTKTKESCTSEESIAEKCLELNTTNNLILSNTINGTGNGQCSSTKETNTLLRIDSSSSSNNNKIDFVKSINNDNEPIKVSFIAENRKQQGDELSKEDKLSGEQLKAIGKTAAIEESSEISCPNICKETDTATKFSVGDASQYIDTKNRKMRTIMLFADKNEALVQNKVNEEAKKEQRKKYSMEASQHVDNKRKTRTITLFADKTEALLQNKEARIEQRNNELTNKKDRVLLKNIYTNKDKANSDRNNNEAHRSLQITVEKYTDTAESSNDEKTITIDESASTNDLTCTVKSKNQVVRKLFSDGNKNKYIQNGVNAGNCYPAKRNERNGTELLTKPKEGDNHSKAMNKSNQDINSTIHDDAAATSNDETIKPCKNGTKKRKNRLSKLFGDDRETSTSDKINDIDRVQNEKDIRRNNSNIHEDDIITSDDEAIKSSKHAVKKRKERLSKLFGDDNETYVSEKDGDNLVQNEQSKKDTRHQSDQYHKGIAENNGESVSNNGGKEVPSVKNNVNALHNAENRTRDNDPVEIDMFDNLLNELDVLTSDTHLNGACAEKEHYVNGEDSLEVRGDKSLEVNKESQKESCLKNIQITNVTSITNKIHIFVCQECNYGTDVYDDVIRHCQNHYNRIEDQVIYCNTCQINYDQACFERHQAYHDNYLANIKIKFSYHWLFTNWQMVFGTNTISLNEAEEMQVKSIYKTFCVKMAVREDGLWQSAVYVCAKCNSCIPPLNIEEHVQQQCTFTSYPCGACDLAFLTQEMRKHHEIYHLSIYTDEDNKQFKTIVFNDKDDENFNATLLLAKAKNNQKAVTVDIFKCLCGLCFNTLKRFKLHFVVCDSEINDGKQCPSCSGVQRFSSTELEEHVSLHESLFKYKFKVKQIVFQQESEIHESEETPSDTFYNTENATQIRSNEESNIKSESLTHDTYEENSPGIEDEKVTRDPKVDAVLKLETSYGATENAAQVRSIDEDLEIKRDMLKDESLTQNSINNNSQEIPNTENSLEMIPVHPTAKETSQENKKAEEPENPISLEPTKETNKNPESGQSDIIECSQETERKESQEIMAVEESAGLTTEAAQDKGVKESDQPTIESLQEVGEASQEIMNVDELDDPITIDDSDDEVEFVGEERFLVLSTPTLAGIFR